MNHEANLSYAHQEANKASKGLEDIYWSVQSDLNGMYDNNNEQLKDMLYAAKVAQALEAMNKARALVYAAQQQARATTKRES